MQQNNQNTALLVLDMQAGTLKNISNAVDLVNKVAKAISYAREQKIKIIYSRVGFREGLPEINMDNKFFSSFKERLANTSVEAFMQINQNIAPLPEDVVVDKRRISAFTGSDLEVILRTQHIQHIVLAGVSTSGVILSTTREASDKDYQITILSDGCADADEEVHRVLTTKVFTKQADVITIDKWMA